MSDAAPTIRAAQPQDIAELTALLLEHGPNPWNYLPEDGIREHLNAIADGSVEAVVAEQGERIVGFVSYIQTRQFADQQPAARRDDAQGYICEAVVHRDMAGKGLGSTLLEQAVARLGAKGLVDIYIDRHEENIASAGMMRKAGFSELHTYADPQRRPNGSRRTTVCYQRYSG
ncbi:GNAT family N-acetyltransferase [Pseudomonas turukhanskensis]|uniref:GNAT family N-acetyltransferase n=1 Tax=Pseudomonas turukhanskensis TaxID=1806536 RepID=A0A9W6NI38_9PSED|nr:GNAT family N-acetyltransferase [Pseudomonas turukhanskensis]GLK91542.1 GNAT family N-acetyltransferase [Pseudomonas turukhanskensis]